MSLPPSTGRTMVRRSTRTAMRRPSGAQTGSEICPDSELRTSVAMPVRESMSRTDRVSVL